MLFYENIFFYPTIFCLYNIQFKLIVLTRKAITNNKNISVQKDLYAALTEMENFFLYTHTVAIHKNTNAPLGHKVVSYLKKKKEGKELQKKISENY